MNGQQYPPACSQPCNECPWRRSSASGWLGPHSPELWLRIVHGEGAIACHKTIPRGGGWGEKTLQCRGAATFRENVSKMPRNGTIETGPGDTENVFATNAEFMEHHQ